MANESSHLTDRNVSTGPSPTTYLRQPANAGLDLNTTAATPQNVSIPGVLFAIPFPPATHAKDIENRPSFLLYAPPRAAYRKPSPGPDGKAGKEKLIKRVERGWQEEVVQGEKIHDGVLPDASRWQRTKGSLARHAAQLIQWLPDSNIEALSRIPPKKKMHEAIVFMPTGATDRSPISPHALTDLESQLARTRKKAMTRTAVSGVLLPFTEALDWFVPIFSFEVDAAYFTSQLQGLRKATALTGDDVHLSLEPSQHLAPLQARLLALCNARKPKFFPNLNSAATHTLRTTNEDTQGAERAHCDDEISPSQPMSSIELDATGPPPGSSGGRILAEAIVAQFRAAVPPEVAGRHAIDDLESLAEDIERCLQKGADEYCKTL